MKKFIISASALILSLTLCACGTAADVSGNADSSAAQDAQNATEATSAPATAAESAYVSNFEIIYQEPELPTGCEITAFAMLLNYYMDGVDKVDLASNYLPTAEYYSEYNAETGKSTGPDLDEYFIGSPFSVYGYVCGTGAIMTAGTNYLSDKKSSLELTDGTGLSSDNLYSLVSDGTPVMVWVTIGMAERMQTSGWYTDDGDYVEWSNNDHAAVLIGYDKENVTIADPIYGEYTCEKSSFESVYDSRGCKCVYVKS